MKGLNIYAKKQLWKGLLLLGAFCIALASLFYTNSIVDKLAAEESKKVELVAEATRKLAQDDIESDISFLFKIIRDNNTVPVICADADKKVLSWRNLDSAEVADDSTFLQERLQEMIASGRAPIVITVDESTEQYIYFEHSVLISLLSYYPYFQLSLVGLFIIISYLAFSSSRNAEQNQVWVGMSKETAHQLGTPLSSLLGWVEFLKTTSLDQSIVKEIKKDVGRLETITDRFSKIGSKTKLEVVDVEQTVNLTIDYLRSRISDKIKIDVNAPSLMEAKICVPLFEWVIENLVKNAVDAMEGKGHITIDVKRESSNMLAIELSDTGKGIIKSDFKKVFKPGFTSKKRGWGLGLSLVKRIIEDYHHGEIFVKQSKIGLGTTFRIELPYNK